MALFEIDVTWWTRSWRLVSSSVRVCVYQAADAELASVTRVDSQVSICFFNRILT